MKKLASLLLCVGLCVGPSRCFAAGSAYEAAVAGLREVGYGTYGEEKTYDSGLCTLFSYSVTARHGPFAHLDLVYKAGSPLGEGTVISLPVPDQNAWGASSAPDQLDWDPEGGRLTYSYYFDTPIYAEDFSSLRRAAGTFTYTVDLHTGEVTDSHTPPLEPARTYDQAVAELRGRSSYCCETVYESELCSVFSYSISGTPHGTFSFLELVYKAGSPLGEGVVLNLPLIKINDWQVTISPDEIALNEDKTVLTYKYHFDAPLTNGGGDRVYYKAGTYIYTVDLASGELTVDHTDELPSPSQPPVSVFSDVPAGSWFEKGVATCAGKGVMVGTGGGAFSPEKTLSQAECLTLAFRLYDLTRGQEHVIEKDPEAEGRITLTLADGTVFEGYGKGRGEENCVFRWWFSPMGTRGGLYAMVPGWQDGRDYGECLKAQDAWLNSHPEVHDHDVPATLTLNGVTYQGTTDCFMAYAPFIFLFNPEEKTAEEVNTILYDAVNQKAAPAPWWRDTVYTIKKRGLEGLFDPAEFTSAPASRGFFAQLIAAACKGRLEQINIVTAIPDLPWEKDGTTADSYREAAYTLYEAGILTGVDSAGSFAAGNTLTRAEAAVMVARALDETQRVTLPPVQDGVEKRVWPSKTEKYDTYDQAVATLRGSWEYRNEQTMEAPDCTIFVYDPGGIMQRSYGVITLIYKPGSQVGEGTALALPHARVQYAVMGRPADTMTLSEDGKTFTYTYYRPEDIVGWVEGVNEGEVLERAGCVTYTVDLPTGAITERFDPPNYQAALAHVMRKRIIAPGEHSEDREVVQTLEADECTVVLTKGRYAGEADDYILSLVYKPGSALGDGTIQRLLLPTTTIVSQASSYNPTDRAPDSLFLSAGGTKLVYAYDFSDRLAGEDTVYHEAGRYVYTVDIATAEQSVKLEDAYEHALAEVTMVGGTWRVDQQFETPLCTILVQHSEGGDGLYPGAHIALVFKEGSPNGAGEVVSLPTKTGRSYYGSIPPHSVSLNEEKTVFTYTYQFDEDQYAVDKTLYYHPTYKAGTYTTTVDLINGTVNEVFVPKE